MAQQRSELKSIISQEKKKAHFNKVPAHYKSDGQCSKKRGKNDKVNTILCNELESSCDPSD